MTNLATRRLLAFGLTGIIWGTSVRGSDTIRNLGRRAAIRSPGSGIGCDPWASEFSAAS